MQHQQPIIITSHSRFAKSRARREKSFAEKILFWNSLHHFGFPWYDEPILVKARDILEKKFFARSLFAAKQLLYVNYLLMMQS